MENSFKRYSKLDTRLRKFDNWILHNNQRELIPKAFTKMEEPWHQNQSSYISSKETREPILQKLKPQWETDTRNGRQPRLSLFLHFLLLFLFLFSLSYGRWNHGFKHVGSRFYCCTAAQLFLSVPYIAAINTTTQGNLGRKDLSQHAFVIYYEGSQSRSSRQGLEGKNRSRGGTLLTGCSLWLS